MQKMFLTLSFNKKIIYGSQRATEFNRGPLRIYLCGSLFSLWPPVTLLRGIIHGIIQVNDICLSLIFIGIRFFISMFNYET